MTTWTLFILLHLYGGTGSAVIPNFVTQTACWDAARKIKAVKNSDVEQFFCFEVSANQGK